MNLLIITVVLFLAIIATNVSNRSGLPSLLLFLFLGVVFSAMGINFNDFHIAEQIATVALMIIMFYGGFGTNWNMAKPTAKEAIVLASLGVVLTAFITGGFCYFILKFSLLESMLLGSVVASTDYASVSGILVSKNLNLKYSTAPLLEIESGSNDPTAYTMTMVFLSLIMGTDISVPVLVLKQVVIGISAGFLLGIIFFKIIEILSLDDDGLFSVFIATIMLGTYSITSTLGGNGFLALYILGIYIGNHEFEKKRDVVFFYDGLSSIFQIAMFFLLGLLSDVNMILKALPVGLIVMLFMLFIARPISVFGLMAPFKMKKNQLALISIAGLRGAAAIAFAIMAVNSGANLSIDVYHIVFVICIFSLLIQGTILPFATKKLDMFDPNDSVLRTFNYYSDKTAIEFIKTTVTKASPWVDKKISEIQIAFNVIIAKIERDNKSIVPRGNTVLHDGDTIVIGGEAYFDKTGQDLLEIKIGENHKWSNKEVKDIDIDEDELIIMIQKPNGDIIVPRGNTILNPGDRAVISKEINEIADPE
ncbi:potassium/proton antiporter [Peptoniphilus sp. MSJ-1]|uniref:Potassium/proton antiporter n=1 Tax=Peptoniphilus ovalis TaxID=2841503 RepID=A0ABS6FDW8_9FIRM|nr:potassium/proton antiporter [Peptoniphilus ovalis]MBU5668379.1 potassium/proton antiporter [Peptoniphilus ovalis]